MEYVNVLDQSCNLLKQVDSQESLKKSEQEIVKLNGNVDVQKTKDYKLTPEDKKLIKEKTKEFITLTMDKTTQYGGNFSEEEKESIKAHWHMLLTASDQIIDQAQTLGDLTLN